MKNQSCLVALAGSILITFSASSQNIKELQPVIGKPINYTPAEQLRWEHSLHILSELNAGHGDYLQLPASEQSGIDSLEMGYGPLTEGVGCSWYCGGGPYKVTASDNLTGKGNITYEAQNLHDFNLFNAWVPDSRTGVIGKRINFYFMPFTPRVSRIIIYNGYQKNRDLWKNNSRAKKIRIYLNDKPYATLQLKDVTGQQSFKIEPVQSKDANKDLVISFEILEVYKGAKFNDLAISEINFDGLDVH